MIENWLEKLYKTLEEREQEYRKVFPKRPPLACNGRWLYGVWIIGNMYGHGKRFYGAYPVGYLERIRSMFPDAENVLHLFSGVIRKGLWKKETTFDINTNLNPDVVGNVRNLKTYFKPETFDLIIADPPYETSDFEKYGQKPFNKRIAIKDCAYITQKNGMLVWLDLRMPMYSKKEWLLVGTIGLIVSTNARFRLCSIFQKVSKVSEASK